jgi:hypothetical protein
MVILVLIVIFFIISDKSDKFLLDSNNSNLLLHRVKYYIYIARKNAHFYQSRRNRMKPCYDPYMMRWRVSGLGWFDTRAEAREAIRQLTNSARVVVMVKPIIRDKLEALAESRQISVSELVRELIESEVNANG